MTTHDVLEFAVSSIIGFFAGYGVCWIAMNAEDANGNRRKSWWLTEQARTAFGLILVVLAISSLGLFYVTNTSQRRIADCQAEVNRETVLALQARSQASRENIQAEHDWLASVADVHATQAARLATTLTYIKALEKLAAAQDQHPLVAKQCY